MYHGNLQYIEGGRRGFYSRHGQLPTITTKFWRLVGEVLLYAFMFAVAAGVSLLIQAVGL